MRRLICVLLLCSLAIAQEQWQGPDFTRAAREHGSFYLNGIGHQYLQGKNYTVVAAAIPTVGGKYFGVKLHVFNRGQKSVNLLPEEVTVADSVGGKLLEPLPATEIADRMRKPPAWTHIVGIAAGEQEPPSRATQTGVPTIADLIRELSKDSSANAVMGYADAPYPILSVRGSAKATGHDSAACDLGCELRNREIGDENGPQLLRRNVRPEQVEQGELLANTIPPEGDAEGVLYFAMPKLTDRAPVSHTGRKSYLVTVAVNVGEEKFQFVFPPK